MCGINGILHFQTSKTVDQRILTQMRDSLAHRGPDDKGIFIANTIGLGQRRLSIIDTSAAGHQPFVSDDKRYVMVFNGEIYNYKDFYPELQADGYTLKTKSDTEVLLQLFRKEGLKMLPKLNGMFAFVIWDTVEKKLTLVRDRMGVKPLYYAFHNESFYFASEQKALFTAGIPLKIDSDGLEEYIFNRFVAGENTLYQNIKEVLPGHVMTIAQSGKVTHEKWWDLTTAIQNQPIIKDPISWFKETFDDSVRLRMVSDIPVGVLLSGGLDSSSTLASLKYQDFKNIETFNIGFKEAQHNESHLAKMLSDQYGYHFNTMQVEDNSLFDSLIEATYFQDEPLMHLNEPHLLRISQLAHSKVKVLLSGEGADELMGGYVRYKALKKPWLLQMISTIGQAGLFKNNPRYEKLIRYSQITNPQDLISYNGSNIYPKDIAATFGISQEPKNDFRKKILNEAALLYPNSLQRQALYFDQHTYMQSLLNRNDRTTMGASIECREPFLDQRLIAGLGSLDDKWLFTGKKGKYILKTAMQDRLPQEILFFKKVGLSTPWNTYLLQTPAFKDEMNDFAKSDLFRMPYFEHIDSTKLIHSFQQGDSRLLPYIMPLFMMHIWLKNYTTQF
ncbi:asparagine synthase (glutamine-hydrolyzing) [Flavobacterium faecale]|uniref:asparagine synthase (glutamine-hydrolyzing) n=1 Tax=Flavobacterium faecale TaxID=1355330 RepID=A0A2S1LCY3_9FLAO|nr:asparagine synthase (glutamine-hydrolyzing) [Flavobacterium faecale]AWG21567.1 asparagine synthase (glutamine-hydrolyzing) [Flavobacterium faecale]